MTAMWDPFQREMLGALGVEPMLRASPALPDDPLLHAVLRAVGLDRDSAELSQVLPVIPPLPALRGNAAAKRALWRRLRTLRSGWQ
jgi:DNA polymerase III psi subunit